MNNAIDIADPPTRVPVSSLTSPRRLREDGSLLKLAPVMLLVIGLMMPPEFRVNLFGQTLYAYRIAWVLLLPWLMIRLLRGQFAWRLNDWLVLVGTAWITTSFVVIYGLERGLPSGLGPTLDMVIPYFIARICISDLCDLRRLLVALCPVFAVFAILLPVEAYSHDRFIRNAAQAVFGSLGRSEFGMTSAFLIASDTRYGFLRAMGPFSHPILAGLFFSSLLPLYYWSGIKGWPRYIGLLSIVPALFTFSSAAFFAILLFIFFAAYDFIQKRVTFLNWFQFIVSISFILTLLHIVSKKGIISVLIRYTLSPVTGYYRLLIWEYGSKSIEENPFFGIGYAAFEALNWMGDSIDAHFLNLAVRHGLPSAVALFLATVLPIWASAKAASRLAGVDSATALGVAVTLTILVIAGFTVTFYGGMLIWFMILLAIGSNVGTLGMRNLARRASPARVSASRPQPPDAV